MKTRQQLATKTRGLKPVSRIASEYRHIMAELKSDVLLNHPARKPKGRWRGRFTIACWVRFPEGLNQQVRLALIYRDGERRKGFKIDTCRANRQTLILLNGNVELDIVGDTTDVALVLEGLSEDSVWILDEFRVEPTGGVTAGSRPLTSRVSA